MPPNRKLHSTLGDPRTPDSGSRTFPEPPLRERFRELNAASSHDAAALTARGKRASLWNLLFTPLIAFFRTYLWEGVWRHGTAGLISAAFAAYEVFTRYAKLWELHHNLPSDVLPTEGVRDQGPGTGEAGGAEKRRSGEAGLRRESFSPFSGLPGLRFPQSSSPPAGFVEQRLHKQIWWLKVGWETTIREVFQSTVGSPQSAVHSRQSTVGSLQSTIRNPQFTDSELRTHDSPAPMIGGRGATRRIDLGERGTIIVRHYRRGGLVRHFLHDLYWDRPPRPFAELLVTEAARQRGVPTVEVLGARIESVTLGLYRGALVTREAAGFLNLWQWLQTRPASGERKAIVTAVARTIAQMHAAGISHADLNLTNILVQSSEVTPQVLVIDFDRARVFLTPLSQRWCERNLRRFHRSLNKLDPQGQFILPADLELFCQAYQMVERSRSLSQ